MISFKVFDTPVKVKIGVLFIIVVLWGGVTGVQLYWHPEDGFWQDLLIGFSITILLIIVDFGHAFAHIFSARYAGAPIDEILLSANMPRTLYRNNAVAPAVHRMRAWGGPIFNLLCFLVSATVYGVVAGHPIARELAAWSTVGHGLLFIMSLAPLPPVDGGTILKWTLVVHGRTEAAADEIVRRVDWMLGIGVCTIGVGLIALRIWWAGVVVVGLSLVVIGIATGKLR